MKLKINERGTKEMRELAVALVILIHYGISAGKQGFKYLMNNAFMIFQNWGRFTEGFKGIAEVDDELFDLTPEEAEAEQNFIAGEVSRIYDYASAKAKAVAVQTYAVVTEIGVLVNLIKTPASQFEDTKNV